MNATTPPPGQADGDPSPAFIRWNRLAGSDPSDDVLTYAWSLMTSAAREFWATVDHALTAAQEPQPASVVTVDVLAAALDGRDILVKGAGRTALYRVARPHDLAVQLLSAIDTRLTDDKPAPELAAPARPTTDGRTAVMLADEIRGDGPPRQGRPTTSLEDAMLRSIDGLNDLVRDMLQSFPDTADEQEWRDRAGALNVHDPDGMPYAAYTEADL